MTAARLARQVFKVPRKAEIYHRLGIQTISPVVVSKDRLADLLERQKRHKNTGWTQSKAKISSYAFY